MVPLAGSTTGCHLPLEACHAGCLPLDTGCPVGVPAKYADDHFTLLFREDSMAERNRKKTYLILIVILLVVILIAYL